MGMMFAIPDAHEANANLCLRTDTRVEHEEFCNVHNKVHFLENLSNESLILDISLNPRAP